MVTYMAIGRVGVLSTWDTICGIADFTSDYVKAVTKSGLDVEVVPLDRDAQRYLSRNELRDDFGRLAKELRAFDVVHVQHEFGFFAGSYGIYESIDNFYRLLRGVVGGGRRVVVTFHTLPPFRVARGRPGGLVMEGVFKMAWGRRVVPCIRRGGVQVISHTRFLRRALVDTGIPAASISVIPVGSPEPLGTMDREQARESLGYSASDRLLAIIGFVASYKGHKVALDAMRVLPPEYQLAVVGGPHPKGNDMSYDHVLKEVRARKLRDRVRVTGYCPFPLLKQYLAASDLVLAPYVSGDLASSAGIAWGLASGRPVVASRIPVFEELNEGAPCVALTTPSAPNELADRIVQLEGDEAGKQALSANALAYVTANSWDKVAQRHVEVYRRL